MMTVIMATIIQQITMIIQLNVQKWYMLDGPTHKYLGERLRSQISSIPENILPYLALSKLALYLQIDLCIEVRREKCFTSATQDRKSVV